MTARHIDHDDLMRLQRELAAAQKLQNDDASAPERRLERLLRRLERERRAS